MSNKLKKKEITRIPILYHFFSCCVVLCTLNWIHLFLFMSLVFFSRLLCDFKGRLHFTPIPRHPSKTQQLIVMHLRALNSKLKLFSQMLMLLVLRSRCCHCCCCYCRTYLKCHKYNAMNNMHCAVIATELLLFLLLSVLVLIWFSPPSIYYDLKFIIFKLNQCSLSFRLLSLFLSLFFSLLFILFVFSFRLERSVFRLRANTMYCLCLSVYVIKMFHNVHPFNFLSLSLALSLEPSIKWHLAF